MLGCFQCLLRYQFAWPKFDERLARMREFMLEAEIEGELRSDPPDYAASAGADLRTFPVRHRGLSGEDYVDLMLISFYSPRERDWPQRVALRCAVQMLSVALGRETAEEEIRRFHRASNQLLPEMLPPAPAP